MTPRWTGRAALSSLLAAGLVLVSGSQLRIWGPIGPGESILLVWAVAVLSSSKSGSWSKRIGTSLVIFIAVSALSLVAGFVVASRLGLTAPDAGRQSAAFLFVAFLIVSVAIARPPLRELTRTMILLAASGLGLLYIGLDTGLIDSWWPRFGRFRGWSVNPNQLVLVLAPLPFLSLTLLRSRAGRSVFVATLIVVWIALATGSKTLPLTWGAAWASLWIACRFRLRTSVSQAVGRSGVALLVFMLVATLLYFGLVWPAQVGQQEVLGDLGWWTREAGQPRPGRPSQLEVRYELAMNGLTAYSASPIFGLGPGSHSGMGRPHLGRGSHNSLIDWTTSSGAVGLLSLLMLAGVATVRLWRTRPDLIPVLVCVVTHGQFHNILRQPLGWVLLTLFLQVGESGIAQTGQAIRSKTRHLRARLSRAPCR